MAVRVDLMLDSVGYMGKPECIQNDGLNDLATVLPNSNTFVCDANLNVQIV